MSSSEDHDVSYFTQKMPETSIATVTYPADTWCSREDESKVWKIQFTQIPVDVSTVNEIGLEGKSAIGLTKDAMTVDEKRSVYPQHTRCILDGKVWKIQDTDFPVDDHIVDVTGREGQSALGRTKAEVTVVTKA